MSLGRQTPAVRAVRVVLVNTSVFDLQTRNLWCRGLNAEMQTGSQEAPLTRKRSAEIDAERLEEDVTSAEADSNRRLALKRKFEGDPHDSEVEKTVMDLLVESWRGNNDPMMRLICSSVSSVINTLQAYTRLVRTGQCVRMTSVDGSTPTTRLASCSTTLLSRSRGLRRFWSFVSWVSGRLLTDPLARSCLAHGGLTSTRVMKTSPSAAVGCLCRNTNVKPFGRFYSHSTIGCPRGFADILKGSSVCGWWKNT